jgi:hypothetical protein
LKPLDPDKLAAAMVDGARKYIDAAMAPVLERLAAAEGRAAAVEAAVVDFVARAVAGLPPAEKGDAGADGRDGAAGQPGRGISKLLIDANGHLVATFTDGTTDDVGLIVGRDGIDGRDGLNGTDGAPGERGFDGPAGKDGAPGCDGANGKDGQDGKSVELETVTELVRIEIGKAGVPDLVQKAVNALPRPADGKDGAPGERGADGLNGKDGEPGKEGPVGKLPLVKAWLDTVHREGDVVSHEGATYQAMRDTGKAPPHADWTCLAAAGRNGADGRSIMVRGTYSEDADYSALDLVALNGGSFIAKRDNPGLCPGEGWQLVASQGKAGKPGERGLPGPAGRGDPGSPVISASIDGNGLLTLVNGDGSAVECDMYPVLSKLGTN